MSSSRDLELVSTIKERWRCGEPPDAFRVIAEHPQLMEAKSLVLDLAYEEYCQRTAAGEAIDPQTYCERFSRYQVSMRRRLEVHELLRNVDGLDEDDAWPEPGDVICGFRLVEELGRGMVGRVFLAEEVKLSRREVVVKLTRAGIHEAETLSRLSHPHIVPLYSTQFESLTGLTVICMPYLGRNTLQDLLDAVVGAGGKIPARMEEAAAGLGPLDKAANPQGLSYTESIVSMGVSLCDALAHTHQRGILHLDLKPSNVLLSASRQPLLLDFNLSLDGGARWSLLGGTMPYMSPEQIQSFVLGDKQVALDARSDIFSLGVILYQLLTGVHPFGAANWRQRPERIGAELMALQTAGPVPAKKRNPRISARLSRLLSRAMAADIAQRPASAREFGELLAKELGGWAWLRRILYRYRVAVGLAAVLATALVVGTVAYAVTRDPPEVVAWNKAEKAVAEERFDDAVGHFSRVIELTPDRHEPWFGRGRAYQELGMFGEAMEDFDEAWALAPQGKYSACSGFSAAADGKFELAVSKFERAIEEGYGTREVWLNLGRCQKNLFLEPSAEKSMRKAVEVSPNFSVGWYNLAKHYQNKRELDTARECIDNAIQGDAPQPEMFASAAVIAYRQSSEQNRAAIRKYLEDGLRYGLNDLDCKGQRYLDGFSLDDPLLKQLRESPQRTEGPLLNPDPLGDPSISRGSMSSQSRVASEPGQR